ncbi:hypothetical protein IKB17_00285 [bacterium]|nr:hypothetical protein [bacterium]
MTNERRIIDEANYKFQAPKPNGPVAIGKGGDPLFMNIRATKAQLEELLDETTTIQDWMQKETCNNVAISCLNNENLKDIYFEIKNGFGDYGPIVLMGFKTPQGVEIPRLKILNKKGEVQEVLTGPFAIEELNKRAIAYQESKSNYEILDLPEEMGTEIIEDYAGNIQEYN